MPLAAKKKTMGSKAKAEDSVVAIRSVPTNVRMFDGSIATKFIAPGEAIPRGDPAVEAEPDAFMDVTNGVPRERAVVALETVRSEGPGGVRTIHKGQGDRRGRSTGAGQRPPVQAARPRPMAAVNRESVRVPPSMCARRREVVVPDVSVSEPSLPANQPGGGRAPVVNAGEALHPSPVTFSLPGRGELP